MLRFAAVIGGKPSNHTKKIAGTEAQRFVPSHDRLTEKCGLQHWGLIRVLRQVNVQRYCDYGAELFHPEGFPLDRHYRP